jgi:hypothetical protein
MRRTNIYLDDRALGALRAVADRQGRSVAELVREAVDEWLDRRNVRMITADEREERWSRIIGRRQDAADKGGWTGEQVDHDVRLAVAEVRGQAPARRR